MNNVRKWTNYDDLPVTFNITVMLLFLLIGGIFFCAAGFFWNSRLLKYETEHRNARGLTQYTGYNGEELHENYKTWASGIKTTGILLLIASGLFCLVRYAQ